jgi:hypothetical protein
VVAPPDVPKDDASTRGERRVSRGFGVGLLISSVLLLGACAKGTVQDALGMGKRAPDEFAVVKRAPLIVPPEYDLRPPDPGAPRPNVGTTSDQARVALTGSGQAEPRRTAQILAGGAGPAIDGNAAVGTGPTAAVPGSVPASSMANDLLAAGAAQPADGPVAATPPVVAPAPAVVGDPSLTPGERAMVGLAGGAQADPGIRRTIAEENQALADVEASLFTRIVAWRQPSTLAATVDAPAEVQRLRTNRAEGKPPTEGDTPTVIQRRQSALQGLLEGIF